MRTQQLIKQGGNHVKIPSCMGLIFLWVKQYRRKFNKVQIALFTAYNKANRVLWQKYKEKIILKGCCFEPGVMRGFMASGGEDFNPGSEMSFPGGSEVKASACNPGDLGLIPGLGSP